MNAVVARQPHRHSLAAALPALKIIVGAAIATILFVVGALLCVTDLMMVPVGWAFMSIGAAIMAIPFLKASSLEPRG